MTDKFDNVQFYFNASANRIIYYYWGHYQIVSSEYFSAILANTNGGDIYVGGGYHSAQLGEKDIFRTLWDDYLIVY